MHHAHVSRFAPAVTIVASLVTPAVAGAEVFGGIDFPQGVVSFADAVVSLEFNEAALPAVEYQDATQTLGPPNYTSPSVPTFLSLGATPNGLTPSELIVEFVDNRLVDRPGNDLYIFEVGPAVEPTLCAISVDGDVWYDLGRIAGSTRAIDIAEYAEVPLDQQFRFVRLRDAEDGGGGGGTAGPDIDAIGAIGSAPPDEDDDGVVDETDNCPATANVDQADADGDDIGDACDLCPGADGGDVDSDGDGIGDACDLCAGVDGGDADSDGDGIGDACDLCPGVDGGDTDSDGDEVGDACDLCPDEAASTTDGCPEPDEDVAADVDDGDTGTSDAEDAAASDAEEEDAGTSDAPDAEVRDAALADVPTDAADGGQTGDASDARGDGAAPDTSTSDAADGGQTGDASDARGDGAAPDTSTSDAAATGDVVAAADADEPRDDGGCGCTASHGPAAGGWWALVAAALVALRPGRGQRRRIV